MVFRWRHELGAGVTEAPKASAELLPSVRELRHVLANIADHPVNRVNEFLPGIAPGSWHLLKTTPLTSGVMSPSSKPNVSSIR